MPEIIGILDTGVFCCWLEVPGKEVAGSPPDFWNNDRARRAVDEIIGDGGTMILPNSVVLEVARLVSQAPNSRRTKAEQLLDRTLASLEPISPWKRFSEFERLWSEEWYAGARREWPDYADRRVSLTDFSLLWIVQYFRELGTDARLITTEAALRSAAEAIPLATRTKQRERR
jgi:hypothetical protein